MSDAIDVDREMIDDHHRAILRNSPGDEAYEAAVQALQAFPRKVRRNPMVRHILGYHRLLEGNGEAARCDFEESYEEAMRSGDWESACWACAHMGLWHILVDDDDRAGLKWAKRGRNLLAHDKAEPVASHLGLMEGCCLMGNDDAYEHAIEILKPASRQFRRQGDAAREIWSTWLQFEVLPESLNKRWKDILGEVDVDYWCEHYDPLSIGYEALICWAKYLAAAGELAEATQLIVDRCEHVGAPQTVLAQVLFELFTVSYDYRMGFDPTPIYRLIDREQLDLDEFNFVVVNQATKMLEHGKYEEMIELMAPLSEDERIPPIAGHCPGASVGGDAPTAGALAVATPLLLGQFPLLGTNWLSGGDMPYWPHGGHGSRPGLGNGDDGWRDDHEW